MCRSTGREPMAQPPGRAVTEDEWTKSLRWEDTKRLLNCGASVVGTPSLSARAKGASTEVIAGEGMILTAGGIDTHIHFICPQQTEEALNSGVTTMIGGGTGPARRLRHRFAPG